MAGGVRCAAWVGCLFALTQAAHAYAPRSGPRVAAETLTALPAAGLAKPLRTHVKLEWRATALPLAWSRFVAQRGPAWHAAWDAATGVPSRIWGAGMPAPGSVANAAVAEQFARQVLADHIAL